MHPRCPPALAVLLAFRPSPPQSLRGQDVIITLSDESTRQGTVHNVDPINFTVALLKVRPSARRWHSPHPPLEGQTQNAAGVAAGYLFGAPESRADG